MNCKPGDLAVIVKCKNASEAVGKIVQCVRFDPAPTNEPAWRIDPPAHKPIENGRFIHPGDWIIDASLRPIRDNDGEDETITWAGKPQQIKETQ